MPHASYSLRPVFWLLWEWEADFNGAVVGRGLAVGRQGALIAARLWLDRRRRQDTRL